MSVVFTSRNDVVAYLRSLRHKHPEQHSDYHPDVEALGIYIIVWLYFIFYFLRIRIVVDLLLTYPVTFFEFFFSHAKKLHHKFLNNSDIFIKKSMFRTIVSRGRKSFLPMTMSKSMRRHQETRRFLFGFGESKDDETIDISRYEKIFQYMKKLEREGKIGSDDLLLEIIQSHDTLQSVDDVLIDPDWSSSRRRPRPRSRRRPRPRSRRRPRPRPRPRRTASSTETASSSSDASPEKSYKDIGSDTSSSSPSSTQSFGADAGKGQPGLTYEQALKVEREALQKLSEGQASMALMAIKNMPGVSLGMRWQQMNGILLGTQLQCITPLGFSNDQAGILAYTNYCASYANSPKNKELKDAMMERWDYAMEHAFGVTDKKPMDVDTARSYTKDLFEGVSDPNFLDRLNAIFQKYGDIKPDDMGQAMKLQSELFPLMFEIQTSVAEKYGYVGDQEYVMAQRALMDHSTDPMVYENTQSAPKFEEDRHLHHYYYYCGVRRPIPILHAYQSRVSP